MDQCPNCNEWWVHCPCCDVNFCHKCGMEENEVEDYEEEES
ncbi:hypothetical protein [Bacillus sp. FSL R12-0074]